MEGHVVLAHHLHIAHVPRALVGAPPAFPAFIGAVRVAPLLGGGDVFDGGVEPDVEDLVLEPRPGQAAPGHRHAPGEVAGDAPVDQPLVQVLVGDGPGQARPFGLGVHPGADLVLHLRMPLIEVARLAHLQVPRAGHRRIGFDQVDRIEQIAAVVALIAPGRGEAAMGAYPLDIAVGQEALVVDGIDHPVEALLDQAVVLQHLGEVLGQGPVLRRGGAAEPVPRQAERAAEVVLGAVPFLAIGQDVLPRRRRRQLRRGAVLVRGADIEGLVPPGPLEARIDIRRQHGARQVAQVLDAVDVGQSRGDEDAGHGALVRNGARI